MQRYNIFKQAYQGLRAALFETSITFQRTDFSNHIEASAAMEKLNESLALFHKSSWIESQYILPVVRQYETVVAEHVEEDRTKECGSFKELKDLAEVYRRTPSLSERKEISDSITKILVRFTGYTLINLDKREQALNEVLLHHFSDKEIQQLKRLIVTRMTPAEISSWGKWIIIGSNNTEIINWLKEVQVYVSPDVFAELNTIAEQVLPTNRYNQVMDGLSEGIWLVSGE